MEYFSVSLSSSSVKVLFQLDQALPLGLQHGEVAVDVGYEGNGRVAPECSVEANPLEGDGVEEASNAGEGWGHDKYDTASQGADVSREDLADKDTDHRLEAEREGDVEAGEGHDWDPVEEVVNPGGMGLVVNHVVDKGGCSQQGQEHSHEEQGHQEHWSPEQEINTISAKLKVLQSTFLWHYLGNLPRNMVEMMEQENLTTPMAMVT